MKHLSAVRDQFLIRPYLAECDESFVFDSWLESYRFGYEVTSQGRRYGPGRDIDKDAYRIQQPRLIRSLLRHAHVRVACSAVNDDQIYGWACADTGDDGSLILHYVYVKNAFRGWGIAWALVAALPGNKQLTGTITHWTPSARSAVRRWGLRWDPYLLYQEILE